MIDTEDLSATAYELLVKGVVDYAIYLLDPRGHVVSWNPGAERIKGYTSDEIVGEHFSRFYTPEDAAAGAADRALKIAADTGRFTTEAWRCRKDGSRFWAMVVIDAIHRGDRLIGFAKVTRDMTERQEAQRAALEAERRFRLLVEGVTDYAIYMLDPDGRVTNWNAGAERIKGYAASEIIGAHFSRFYPPEDLDFGLPDKALAAARRDGRYEAEGWRCRKDGTRFWASVLIDAVHDNGELVGFAKITRDLTERREAQMQLEQSREQLFHAQKMEAIGQLTGGIAHDFNNLLTGISGSLELLKARVANGRIGDLDRYITGAQGAASRAAALTHRLLAFARRQPLDPKQVNANSLLTGMLDLVQRTVGPGIKVSTTFMAGLWPSLCDPHQLENAILNLCINARDAMPNGGSLGIRTANACIEDLHARDGNISPGQYIEICVTDTGTGMSPDVVARVFEPFFTTKPIGQGTGLGLSMVYGFVTQSSGQVRITSQVGVGTNVMIYLPRDSGVVEDDAPKAETAEPARATGGETVLIVDDEPTVRMLITEVLEGLGYSAIEAADGASGLKVLQSNVHIDLLITDIGLPGSLSGFQMVDGARTQRPGLKVLFITAYPMNSVSDSNRLNADTQILAKPFHLEMLASRVGAMLAKT
jgi:PAS domain S-box-containing protein